STQERLVEVRRDRPLRRLRGADLAPDGCGVAHHHHFASSRQPLRIAPAGLAPGAVLVRRLRDRVVVDSARHGSLIVMADAETKSKPSDRNAELRVVRSQQPPARNVRTPWSRLLITLATTALAAAFGWAMWDAYMGAPWTRDGTVRTYVVTMAPEVAGRIVELPARDNQFVHKGDLLMVIDPTNFKIAVSLNEATVQQAQANMWNTARESQRRQALSDLSVTTEQRETFATSAVSTRAQYQQALANLQQAKVNLERTEIRSPVNGW